MSELDNDFIVKHLFEKMDNISEILSQTLQNLSAINTKLELLETNAAKGAETMTDMEARVIALETRVTKIQNDLKWVAGIMSFVGGVVGFVFKACVELFKG